MQLIALAFVCYLSVIGVTIYADYLINSVTRKR